MIVRMLMIRCKHVRIQEGFVEEWGFMKSELKLVSSVWIF
jgi:hypothetical protein